ncbi:hypothetical protein [Mycolicibacterium fortuitum]|uniref:hypothetical protein n=1 Tax=Mycolicibacterium fortuitum TaxID=1766 RepID=UPI001CE1F638|nr:hypothetical protein [Mycolicibacterium fortuitum]MCA4727114.1 hypothetical protein [Mycolicibacterium fortuitum]
MTEILTGDGAIADALRRRMRVGEGLSVPYARKWSVGGCDPTRSLWSYPHNAIRDFAAGLATLAAPVVAADDLITIGAGVARVWVAANGTARNAEDASAFLLGRPGEELPVVVINSPEVAVELIAGLAVSPASCPDDELIQIGFPGVHLEDRVYVGSWRWNVHAEVRGEEFVCRTAHAILAAVRLKESEHDS